MKKYDCKICENKDKCCRFCITGIYYKPITLKNTEKLNI